VAYAVSGDASVSGDQRLHEGVRVHDLKDTTVAEIMHTDVVSVQASVKLHEFAHSIMSHSSHSTFPVLDHNRIVGTISSGSLQLIATAKLADAKVADAASREFVTVRPDCDAMEALRLLLSERAQSMLLVTSQEGKLEGVVTKTDLLEILKIRGEEIDTTDEKDLHDIKMT
jgi:CIC family chloride channel protein